MDESADMGGRVMEDLDMAIIDGEQWAKEMWATLSERSQKGFLNWCKIVLKLGLDKERLKNWSQIVIDQVDDTYAALVADVSDLNAKTCEKIEELLCQLQEMCQELHRPMPSEIGSQGLSLFEEKQRLVEKIEEYKQIIDSQKAEIKELCRKEISYCKTLGMTPKSTLKCSPLPNQEELSRFKEYVEQLEDEKFRREEKFFEIKEDIESIVKELDYTPTSDFERMVLYEGHFLVTRTNMENLDLFHKHLKEQLKSTEEEISRLRTRIEDLWRMLEIDFIESAEFRNRYTGKSLVTLEAMRRETKRCEEIRKKNIKTFIEKLRRELDDVWARCHCSEEDKISFSWYTCDVFTEDLLCLHEMEIQKWKKYYDENAKLLGLIQKHAQLWERATELDEIANATGANRFKNRGGKLLQEEKDRNKLSKMIPKLEDDMRALALEFEDRTSKPFYTNGLTVDQYINHLRADRDNNRKLKLSARKLNRENTMLTPAKSGISLFASTSTAVTPRSAPPAKRKILATPNSAQTKKPRMLATTPASDRRPTAKPKPLSTVKPKNIAPVPQIKIINSTVTSLRKRRSSGRMQRCKAARRLSGKKQEKDDPESPNTTYSEFQNDLSSNDKIRSTIIAEDLEYRPEGLSTPKKRTPRVPRNTPQRTPMRITPISPGTSNASKLSTCKNSLKLFF